MGMAFMVAICFFRGKHPRIAPPHRPPDALWSRHRTRGDASRATLRIAGGAMPNIGAAARPIAARRPANIASQRRHLGPVGRPVAPDS